ncbi:hypothetical protein HGO34_15850 [Agrobacterium vitis]|uniref:hypothetical protein n=1 Tax=Agrobacterium vitis TaxID=373 RepID=UPI001F2A2CC8|nr:hypothetical protein [Agrobacterium vitis]MCF1498902.1 hypothetical protein [Allorhizobium sp. Av2]MCM2441196.1 hypothetical protein [Agrobacterium vitis]
MSGLETIALLGAGLGGAGSIVSGVQANNNAKYQAENLRQQGTEALASSQRSSMEKYRQGKITMSGQRAAIAGSGGSIADPGVIDMMSDTYQQTDLAGRTEMYKGEQQKRGYDAQASAAEISGKNALTNGIIGGVSSTLSNSATIFDRFGKPAKQGGQGTGIVKPYG